MEVHLIDGTYELFRHFHALPPAKDSEGRDVAAVRGVLGSLLGMMQAGTTYIGVATDHVIESFRNRMWPGYKTGQGVEPELLAQFPLLEETLCALGVVVWAMEEYEADDALASAAFLAREDIRVKRVVISTPDKDLAQCVQGTRVVQLDRRSVSNAMSRESSRSSESNQAPFRITSPWLVTRQTGIRGCQDGVRSLLRLFCRVLANWKRSHPTHGIGR